MAASRCGFFSHESRPQRAPWRTKPRAVSRTLYAVAGICSYRTDGIQNILQCRGVKWFAHNHRAGPVVGNIRKIRPARSKNDTQIGPKFTRLCGKYFTRHAGQTDIGNQDIDRPLDQKRQPIFGIGGLEHGVAEFTRHRSRNCSDIGFVFDEKNRQTDRASR